VDIYRLMEVINQVRLKVWQQQPDSFFDEAVIEGDGSMVETTGECKQGIDFNYKNQLGYHTLLISLANTDEPLFIVNRSGNRPSHENAATYFDQSIALCREAGFRKITLRGDTDFSQTAYLDGWDEEGVRFIFGIDAMPNLYEIVENLPETAWKRLKRPPRYEVKTQPRQRPENVKQRIVEEREYEDLRLVAEHVAEFEYQPTACHKKYRVVAVWKDIELHKGQKMLFRRDRCFFYITNDWDCPAEHVVREANQRCNQENLIQQGKAMGALAAPLDNLVSNWAYMVIASLAWNLKAWAALLLPVNNFHKAKHEKEKRKLLRMDFSTFRNAMINIPAQIITSGRRIIYRLLAWNSWQPAFFRLLDRLQTPLSMPYRH
jgi:hypothetical protein